ncbi:MAG: ester cyclase [Leptospirillia bacterium]
MSSPEALIRRFWQIMWHTDAKSMLSEIITPDAAFRGSLGNTASGPSGVVAYARNVQLSFPDFAVEPADFATEGERVYARLRLSGTHKGELFGCAPSGRRIEYHGMALHTVRDGLIHSIWVVGDTLDLARQAGASLIPAPEPLN